jgi:hypothetical protein
MVFYGFALHARRLQIPSTEYASRRWSVDHATISHARVIGTKLHERKLTRTLNVERALFSLPPIRFSCPSYSPKSWSS